MNFFVNENTRTIELELKDFPRRLVKKADRAAHRFIQRVTADAKVKAPEAESTLKNSIKAKKLGLLDYESGTNQSYGDYVETGTRSGGVPTLQSLLDWIRVRRIKPNTRDYTQRDLAFAIQQKIKKEGTPAQPYMFPSLNENLPLLSMLMAQQVNGAA